MAPSCLFCSLCKFLQCLVSALTKRAKVATYLGSLFSCAVGREGHCNQIPLAFVRSAHTGWTTSFLQPKTACTSQVHTAQALVYSARAIRPKWTLHFMYFFPRLMPLRFLVFCKDIDSDGLCTLCLSQVQATWATECL